MEIHNSVFAKFGFKFVNKCVNLSLFEKFMEVGLAFDPFLSAAAFSAAALFSNVVII